MNRDAYIESISRFLDQKGIATYHFERRAKHRAVMIDHDGHVYMVVFPASGSDTRGPLNAVSTIRHVLGLVDASSHSDPIAARGPRRQKLRRARPANLPAPRFAPREPSAETEDRFYAPLERLKAQLAAAAATTGARPPLVTPPTQPAQQRVRLLTPYLGHRQRFQQGAQA